VFQQSQENKRLQAQLDEQAQQRQTLSAYEAASLAHAQEATGSRACKSVNAY
jgi:hypothetical protein